MEEGFYRVVTESAFKTNLHIIQIKDNVIYPVNIQFWEDTDSKSVSPKMHTPYISNAKNIEEYLQINFPHDPKAHRLIKIEQKPGAYYPRIYRPALCSFGVSRKPYFDKHEKAHIEITNYSQLYLPSLQLLGTFKERLVTIFNYVYPFGDNFSVYSHEIRSLLILASSEVEAQMKGILKANGYKLKSKKPEGEFRFSTKDYIKLLKVLQLEEYAIRLPYYSQLEYINPFAGWANTPSPTSTLAWYNAYNLTKHDSETHFTMATLNHALDAVCSVYILLVAQYGKTMPNLNNVLGNFFQIRDEPNFSFEESYLPPIGELKWTPENHKF